MFQKKTPQETISVRGTEKEINILRNSVTTLK
jgi:hypothetical protein